MGVDLHLPRFKVLECLRSALPHCIPARDEEPSIARPQQRACAVEPYNQLRARVIETGKVDEVRFLPEQDLRVRPGTLLGDAANQHGNSAGRGELAHKLCTTP